MALGSSFELETQLILANRLGYIQKSEYKSLEADLHILQSRINTLISKID